MKTRSRELLVRFPNRKLVRPTESIPLDPERDLQDLKFLSNNPFAPQITFLAERSPLPRPRPALGL